MGKTIAGAHDESSSPYHLIEEINAVSRIPDRPLDHLDLNLMRELEIDARQTNLQLAKKLNISETTVRRRIQQLVDDGVIRFGVLPNRSALRFEMAMLGINAHPGVVDAVADKLVERTDIPFVSITSGRYNILAWVVFHNIGDLSRFIDDVLAVIDGLATYEIMPILSYVKNSWAFLNDADTLVTKTQVNTELDDVDYALIKELQANPRETYKNLANRLKISRATVSSKVQHLLDNSVLRIISFVDPSSLGYTLRAGILMKVHPSKMGSVLDELSADKDIHRILVASGRYNVVAWRVFRGAEDLSHFLRHRLGNISGIISYENVISLRTVKVSFGQLMINRTIPAK